MVTQLALGQIRSHRVYIIVFLSSVFFRIPPHALTLKSTVRAN